MNESGSRKKDNPHMADRSVSRECVVVLSRRGAGPVPNEICAHNVVVGFNTGIVVSAPAESF